MIHDFQLEGKNKLGTLKANPGQQIQRATRTELGAAMLASKKTALKTMKTVNTAVNAITGGSGLYRRACTRFMHENLARIYKCLNCQINVCYVCAESCQDQQHFMTFVDHDHTHFAKVDSTSIDDDDPENENSLVYREAHGLKLDARQIGNQLNTGRTTQLMLDHLKCPCGKDIVSATGFDSAMCCKCVTFVCNAQCHQKHMEETGLCRYRDVFIDPTITPHGVGACLCIRVDIARRTPVGGVLSLCCGPSFVEAVNGGPIVHKNGKTLCKMTLNLRRGYQQFGNPPAEQLECMKLFPHPEVEWSPLRLCPCACIGPKGCSNRAPHATAPEAHCPLYEPPVVVKTNIEGFTAEQLETTQASDLTKKRHSAGMARITEKACVPDIDEEAEEAEANEEHWDDLGPAARRERRLRRQRKLAELAALVVRVSDEQEATVTAAATGAIPSVDADAATTTIALVKEQMATCRSKNEVKARLFGLLNGRMSILGPSHFEIGQLHTVIGKVLVETDTPLEALPHFAECLRIWEKKLSKDHIAISTACSNLGKLLLQQGHAQKAVPLLHRALRIKEGTVRPKEVDLANAASDLGSALWYSERHKEAMVLYKKALIHRERAFGAFDVEVAKTLSTMSKAQQALGELDSAEAGFTRALNIYVKENPAQEVVGTLMNNLASVSHLKGETEKAREQLEKAIAIWTATLGADHMNVITGQVNLAHILSGGGHDGEARLLLEKSMASWELTKEAELEGSVGYVEAETQIAKIALSLAKVCVLLGEKDKAKMYFSMTMANVQSEVEAVEAEKTKAMDARRNENLLEEEALTGTGTGTMGRRYVTPRAIDGLGVSLEVDAMTPPNRWVPTRAKRANAHSHPAPTAMVEATEAAGGIDPTMLVSPPPVMSPLSKDWASPPKPKGKARGSKLASAGKFKDKATVPSPPRHLTDARRALNNATAPTWPTKLRARTAEAAESGEEQRNRRSDKLPASDLEGVRAVVHDITGVDGDDHSDGDGDGDGVGGDGVGFDGDGGDGGGGGRDGGVDSM